MLKRVGCDRLAMESFFLLASLPSDEARYHANNICQYLLAKKVQNPSRLVHKWASDCRRRVCDKLDIKYGYDQRKKNSNTVYEQDWANDDATAAWGDGASWKRRKRN